jgi:exopolyphosphatase
LEYGGLKSSDLITLEEVYPVDDPSHQLKPENTKWMLVDHNALQGVLGEIYAQRVGGVIDHHDEEHKVSEDTGCEPRIVEKVGSCTSLVTNYCSGTWDEISSSSTGDRQASLWDVEVAKMALSSILIDTVNLTHSTNVTAHDRKAVQYLEAKIRSDPESARTYDRQRLFQEVSSAKQDIGRLCINDILRKDYKEWVECGNKLGISTVVKPLKFLIQKASEEKKSASNQDDLVSSLDAFCEQQNLDLYGIMTAFIDEHGDFHRELLLRSMNRGCNAAAENFERNAQEELGLSTWSGPKLDNDKSTWQMIWTQQQIQLSRKRIAPLLREAMR